MSGSAKIWWRVTTPTRKYMTSCSQFTLQRATKTAQRLNTKRESVTYIMVGVVTTIDRHLDTEETIQNSREIEPHIVLS